MTPHSPRETCGQIPVLHNGDFFPCDYFVDREHCLGNIRDTPLCDLLESPAQRAFGEAKLYALPRHCRECEVLPMCNGGCPKHRILHTPDGEPGLNYLCSARSASSCTAASLLLAWHPASNRAQSPHPKPDAMTPAPAAAV